MIKQKLHFYMVRYQEQIRYVIVGGGTTVVNYGLFFLLGYVGLHYIFSNVLAWLGAVIFAYYMNGAWVYRSTSNRGIQEAFAFAMSRVFSLVVETVLLSLMVEWWGISEIWSKLIVSVVVVVLNYITGLWVYKKGR